MENPRSVEVVDVALRDWRRALRDAVELPIATRGVALVVGEFMTSETGDGAFPSHELLQQSCGLGRSQTKHHVAVLIRAGYLRKTRAGQAGQTAEHRAPGLCTGHSLGRRGPRSSSLEPCDEEPPGVLEGGSSRGLWPEYRPQRSRNTGRREAGISAPYPEEHPEQYPEEEHRPRKLGRRRSANGTDAPPIHAYDR